MKFYRDRSLTETVMDQSCFQWVNKLLPNLKCGGLVLTNWNFDFPVAANLFQTATGWLFGTQRLDQVYSMSQRGSALCKKCENEVNGTILFLARRVEVLLTKRFQVQRFTNVRRENNLLTCSVKSDESFGPARLCARQTVWSDTAPCSHQNSTGRLRWEMCRRNDFTSTTTHLVLFRSYFCQCFPRSPASCSHALDSGTPMCFVVGRAKKPHSCGTASHGQGRGRLCFWITMQQANFVSGWRCGQVFAQYCSPSGLGQADVAVCLDKHVHPEASASR